MSIGYVKRITFLCPPLLTGGPEAIHQVSQILNAQGVPTDIAYYGENGSLRVEDGRMVVEPPADNPCLIEYAGYEPVVCRSALLRRHHLIVLPEPLATQTKAFQRASVAIWWLSVDNALPHLNEAARRALFADRSLKHFHQSAYAEDFLRRSGVPASYPLGDFTDPQFTAIVPAAPNPDPAIAYNPVKGADVSARFFEANPQVPALPLRGMTKAELVAAMRRTMVYVDFGNLPGKDRLPREAAASGAIVFVRKQGAGRFHEDFPIPDFFRFDEDDVDSGDLARRIAAVQERPEAFWDDQERFRERIRSERAELAEQVRALRGRARAA